MPKHASAETGRVSFAPKTLGALDLEYSDCRIGWNRFEQRSQRRSFDREKPFTDLYAGIRAVMPQGQKSAMSQKVLIQIRDAILAGRYALSEHAYDEMDEDGLDVLNSSQAMYDFTCEHCGGQVQTRRVEREALRHKASFVILEDVPIGVCDKCGARYFDARVARRVAEMGRGVAPSERTVEVPVERY